MGVNQPDEFAADLARTLAGQHPELTTEQRKESRGDRVYLDVMRNAYAQSVIAPYAARARPGAPVATPLHWAEVEDKKLDPAAFTIRSIARRLDSVDDPWDGLTGRRYGLDTLRRRLDKL